MLSSDRKESVGKAAEEQKAAKACKMRPRGPSFLFKAQDPLWQDDHDMIYSRADSLSSIISYSDTSHQCNRMRSKHGMLRIGSRGLLMG